MDNKVNPWELLREAREYVGFCPFDPNLMNVVGKIRARIDAALAAHEAEMIEHKKNFARDCKDFDRTMAAWKNG